MNRKIVVLGVLLISSFAHAALPPESFWAKVVKRAGSSKLIQKYNAAMQQQRRAAYEKKCAGRVLEPVDFCTQILFNVAQYETGRPQEEWLPVFPEPNASCVATARPGFFTVDSSTRGFRTRPYGYQRFIAHHENAHDTYNHFALILACEIGAIMSTFVLSNSPLSKVATKCGLRGMQASGIAFGGSILSAKIARDITREVLKKTTEAQADREGALATRCWCCLSEATACFREKEQAVERSLKDHWSAAELERLMTEVKEQLNEERVSGGYRPVAELEQIAMHFKAENKVCDYHQSKEREQQDACEQ